MTTIFFTTDIHGSEICWRKFINAGKFYHADVLVMGGDISGKAVVPIVHQGNQTYRAVLLEQAHILHGEDEVLEMERKIRSRGYYPYRTDADEMESLRQSPERVHTIFEQAVLRTAQNWLEYADGKLAGSGIRCFVTPGNDDMPDLDGVLSQSKTVTFAEGAVVALDERLEMVCSGYSNITPWHSFREETEEQLLTRYEALIARLKDVRHSVFAFHVPPYGSGLDDAPELTADLRPKYAGNALVPVGSRSARKVIERYQPLLGLFGHIHECKATTRIGKTLCVNSGSMYEQGVLCGALIQIERGKIKSHILTTG